MPAKRLAEGAPERITKFSVIGNYVTDAGSRFVRHVAILRSDAHLYYGCQNILVWHMGPPLVAGGISALTATPEQTVCEPHLIGMIDLDADDMEGIDTWLADVDKEKRPAPLEQYIVRPAMRWVSAENNARLYRQFSCVGFVLECYRSIGVNLLDDLEPSQLPEVDIDTVAAAYGKHVRRDWLRERLGIPGPGPWRIALAGYIFHSLKRTTELVRSVAHIPENIGERHYPSE